jgi:hypothetical protein
MNTALEKAQKYDDCDNDDNYNGEDDDDNNNNYNSNNKLQETLNF